MYGQKYTIPKYTEKNWHKDDEYLPPPFQTSSREKRMSIDRHGDEKAKELPSYGFIFPSYVRNKIICWEWAGAGGESLKINENEIDLK